MFEGLPEGGSGGGGMEKTSISILSVTSVAFPIVAVTQLGTFRPHGFNVSIPQSEES